LLDADALLPVAPATAPSLLPPASSPDRDEDPDTLVSRAPDAKGTFAVTPLVYALVHALDRRMTGTFAVRPEGAQPTFLMLDDGAVVQVDASKPGDRLGEEAVLAGVCTEAQLASALAKSRRDGTRLGVELVSQAGASPDMVKHLLLIQAAKRIAELVNLPGDTSYTLHLGQRPREPYEPWAPLDVILAAVRAWTDRPRIHGTMRFIGTRPLTLHPDADLSGLVTLPNESVALEAMRAGEVTLEALYRSTGGGLSSLIYMLAVTRQFVFSAEKGPPMGRAFGVVATGPKLSPTTEGEKRPLPPPPVPSVPPAADKDPEPLATPYELEQSASPAIVIPPLARPVSESFAVADTTPGAFLRRTTAPYPIDPAPRSDPAGVPHLSSAPKPVILPLPAREAAPPPVPLAPAAAPLPVLPIRAVPLPPKKKESAVTAPPSAAPPPPPTLASSGGLHDYALAEAALARHDFKTAELHAARATHSDPKNPDYAALFAWVCAHGGEENALAENVRALTRVLEDHPKCEAALYFRGMLLKRAGKDKTALRDFVMILYQNPSHPQALTEVRELRKKKR
jgi:hypothetical protein